MKKQQNREQIIVYLHMFILMDSVCTNILIQTCTQIWIYRHRHTFLHTSDSVWIYVSINSKSSTFSILINWVLSRW